MRTLYQFPLSHYCEKARWLLDHKELDYVAHNLIPGVHRAFTQLKTGQNKLPVLKDHKKWIAGSTQIALYLDENYPEHGLFPRDQHLHADVLKIDELALELGIYVRRWGLAFAIRQNDEPIEIILGERGYLRDLEKFSKPILKGLLKKNYKIEAEKVVEAKVKLDEYVQFLNQLLLRNGGQYLVADRLGLADISVCSMLAPLLGITGTPWEWEDPELQAPEVKAFRDELLSLPLGQYVQRIYQQERNARVDWRGI